MMHKTESMFLPFSITDSSPQKACSQFSESISFYNLWRTLHLSTILITGPLSCWPEMLQERGCLGHCPWRIELLANYRPFPVHYLDLCPGFDLASGQRRRFAFVTETWMNEMETNRELNNKPVSLCSHTHNMLYFILDYLIRPAEWVAERSSKNVLLLYVCRISR